MNARLIEKATTLKTTKGESQNAFKRINQAKVSAIRLTHTGRQVSPSGLKPNSLTPRSCRQRSGIHGKQEKQGTTEHTETTEAGHKRRENSIPCIRCVLWLEYGIATQPQDPLAKRVGSIRKIPRLQPLGIKSFVFEPPLTQRLCVAFLIASAV
jgi:hypothetical protein